MESLEDPLATTFKASTVSKLLNAAQKDPSVKSIGATAGVGALFRRAGGLTLAQSQPMPRN